ncbi:MAG: GNAT family N-acetyltransferase [Deltaproteobacteria bacterium]|nr:GNAT family N-acetyltransferase [Deltaproteobacteria bacterium]
MSDLPFTIRNYRPADFKGYLRLHIESEPFDQSGRYISSRMLAESLRQPNYCPEKNGFIVEKDNKIIAFAGLTPEAGIRRVLLDGLVHPRFRKQGVATALFSRTMQRAQALGAKVMQISIPEANAAASGLVSSLGFRFIRHFLELKLVFYNTDLPDVKRAPFVIRELRDGEEGVLTVIQNRSFAGSWGFNPNTTEEIVYRINMRDSSPADVLMACDGDKSVGYCWTRVNTEENRLRGENRGQIHMMGVDPDYRKKGVGKVLLLKGLERLRSKSVDVVELTVDSQNKAGRALYAFVGFELDSRTEWYEKRVG